MLAGLMTFDPQGALDLLCPSHDFAYQDETGGGGGWHERQLPMARTIVIL